MCGITGFARTDSTHDVQRIIELMGDRIKHRGPDDVGYHIDDTVALVHRRLSIIDLESGKQPIYNEDGSCVIVYNGEVYNFLELREELIARGAKARVLPEAESGDDAETPAPGVR